jgi:hypothetical protein
MCLKIALSWGGGNYIYFSIINAALIHFVTEFSLKHINLTGDEIFNPHSESTNYRGFVLCNYPKLGK